MYGMRIINRLSSIQRTSKLKKVLSREVPSDTLSSLIEAISRSPKNYANINSSAIGLDANVILRLPKHKKAVDIIDYLNQRSMPLILPSQTIQEFWNNSLSVIDTVGQKIKKKFDDLRKEGKDLGPEFESFSTKMNTLLTEFDQEFGFLYDEKTIRDVKNFLETLKGNAYISSVNRIEFSSIAEMRKKTKTPPGFLDNGDGDFYVWTELLYGAMKAIDEGHKFDRLILITNDAKLDWVREGIAHPILNAESKALLGIPFEIWKLEEFVSAIESEIAT